MSSAGQRAMPPIQERMAYLKESLYASASKHAKAMSSWMPKDNEASRLRLTLEALVMHPKKKPVHSSLQDLSRRQTRFDLPCLAN